MNLAPQSEQQIGGAFVGEICSVAKGWIVKEYQAAPSTHAGCRVLQEATVVLSQRRHTNSAPTHPPPE